MEPPSIHKQMPTKSKEDLRRSLISTLMAYRIQLDLEEPKDLRLIEALEDATIIADRAIASRH